jgi:uncharacterized phage-like protein YoqJ
MEGCSFSGHRAIAQAKLAPLKDLLRRAIAYAYEQGCRSFYCGGAVGFDTYAAKEIILFRVKHPDVRLILLLPCADQSEGWSDMQRAAYDYILSEADEAVILSDSYARGCMQKRNRALVERADMLICYVGREGSGSAQTLHLAEKKGIPVYNLYAHI